MARRPRARGARWEGDGTPDEGDQAEELGADRKGIGQTCHRAADETTGTEAVDESRALGRAPWVARR
jgi:hypothetical protein